MTEFRVEVVRLGKFEKHENADSLSITHIHGDVASGTGYPCIVKTGDFREGDLAVYVPVDAVVPTIDKRFAFLMDKRGNTTARIKARRLRGVFSMGLLVRPDEAWEEGDNVQDLLKIKKYEPDESNRPHPGRVVGGSAERDPKYVKEYTDIEGLRRWGTAFELGEEVIITEKLHGASSRYVWKKGRLWVGSRNVMRKRPGQPTWKDWLRYWLLFVPYWMGRLAGSIFRTLSIPFIQLPRHPARPHETKTNDWWEIAFNYDLETKLKTCSDIAVYGEIYGPVQDLKYGSPDKVKFVAFDAMDTRTGKFLNYQDFEVLMKRLDLPTAPLLYRGPWTEDCRALAEGKTTMPNADHVREGIVIRPTTEVSHPRLGRKILKLVGEGYLTRKDA